MKITQKIGGQVVREMDIDISPEQIQTWAKGADIADAMPDLSDDEQAMVWLLAPWATRPGLAESPWFVSETS